MALVQVGASFKSQLTDVIITVNPQAQNAEDSNKGTTPSEPLKTLTRALDIATEFLDRGVSVKIKLASGVYEETCRLRLPENAKLQRETLLVIEGSSEAPSVISGLTSRGISVQPSIIPSAPRPFNSLIMRRHLDLDSSTNRP